MFWIIIGHFVDNKLLSNQKNKVKIIGPITGESLWLDPFVVSNIENLMCLLVSSL